MRRYGPDVLAAKSTGMAAGVTSAQRGDARLAALRR
jgi:hypothetical protein